MDTADLVIESERGPVSFFDTVTTSDAPKTYRGCVAKMAVWLCGCVAVELRFVLEAAMSLDAMLGSRLAATEADAQ